MTEDEKAMLVRLETIRKGMSKSEVQAIIGPKEPPNGNAWDYYLGVKKQNAATAVYLPAQSIPSPNGTVYLPATVISVEQGGFGCDSCARVKFKNNGVTQIHFTAVGRWFFYVLK